MRALVFTLVLALSSLSALAQSGKVPTDEVVRTEMKAIRDLTLDAHTLVTHRRMPPTDARTYHAKVKAAVARIRSDSTMEGEAREEIEKLAGYIEKGAGAVAGVETMEAIDGMLIIDDSLSIYAQRFDHPGWQPLR